MMLLGGMLMVKMGVSDRQQYFVRLRNYLLEHKKYQQTFLAPLSGNTKPSSNVKKCQQAFLVLCRGSNWRKDFDIYLDVC